MEKLMKRAILAAAIALSGGLSLASSSAFAFDPGLPWCLIYTGDDARLCDYPTRASCEATASGNVGYCAPNPAFFPSNEQAYGSPSAAHPLLPPPPRRGVYR
jgi:hypothetical protein